MISSTPVRRDRYTIWMMSVRDRSSRRPSRLMIASREDGAWRGDGSRRTTRATPLPSALRALPSASRGQIVAFQNPVQYPVDELAGFLGPVLFGDLDGLIDDHQLRRVVLVEKFVDRHADDVAVHGGHAGEPPVLGLVLDHLVDLAHVRDRAVKDLRRELARVRLRLLQILERVDDLLRTIPGDIVL